MLKTNNVKSVALCVAIGISAFLAGSFSSFRASDDPAARVPGFIDAMSDFEFVGSGVFSDELSVPAHSIESQPLPKKWEAGRAYIFHHSRVDNSRLLRELIDKLKSRGVKVFDIVDHGTGRYIGGLAFKLSFQEGGYRGFIYNTLDNRIVADEKITEPLSDDDYILVLQEAER